MTFIRSVPFKSRERRCSKSADKVIPGVVISSFLNNDHLLAWRQTYHMAVLTELKMEINGEVQLKLAALIHVK